MEKLENLMRKIAGRCEDASADDETWGYPNMFGDLMIEFDDLAQKFLDMQKEYLDSVKKEVREEFDSIVENAFLHYNDVAASLEEENASVCSDSDSEDDDGENSPQPQLKLSPVFVG